MSPLAFLVLWLHLLSVVAWLGGTIGSLAALRAVPEGDTQAVVAIQGTLLGLRRWGGRALDVLVVTGILNALLRTMGPGPGASGTFLALLGTKVALVLPMLGLHGFYSRGLSRGLGRGVSPEALPEAFGRFRRRSMPLLGANLALGALVILVATALRYT